jgi:hypothetical protein
MDPLRFAQDDRAPGLTLKPQGLKPAYFMASNGTAEAVPFPKPFLTSS